MSITNGYLSLDEATAYVGALDTRDSAELEDVVTAASRLIDRHCGRHFYQVTATARVFDSRDGYSVEFGPFNDLVSITTLKTDDNEDGTFETTRNASTYQLLSLSGKIPQSAPVQWPYEQLRMLGAAELPTVDWDGRRGLVEVTGTWGWPAVPPEVKSACRLIVAELAKMKDAPLGTFAGPMDTANFVRNQMPPRARDLLAPFRHPLNVGLA